MGRVREEKRREEKRRDETRREEKRRRKKIREEKESEEIRCSEAWATRGGDKETEVPKWVKSGTPLGIQLPIGTCGIFRQLMQTTSTSPHKLSWKTRRHRCPKVACWTPGRRWERKDRTGSVSGSRLHCYMKDTSEEFPSAICSPQATGRPAQRANGHCSACAAWPSTKARWNPCIWTTASLPCALPLQNAFQCPGWSTKKQSTWRHSS